VVGAAHIGAALDVGKAELERLFPQLVEQFGADEFRNRKVPPAGGQVLADTEEGTAGLPQVMEDLEDLLLVLPHPEHEARLCGDFRRQFPAQAQEFQ